MNFKFLLELPPDYVYRLIEFEGQLKIIGAHPDKEPICFIIEADHKIKKMQL